MLLECALIEDQPTDILVTLQNSSKFRTESVSDSISSRTITCYKIFAEAKPINQPGAKKKRECAA